MDFFILSHTSQTSPEPHIWLYSNFLALIEAIYYPLSVDAPNAPKHTIVY